MIESFAQRLIDSDDSVRKRFGFEVVSAADGACQLKAAIDSGWLNGAGFIHGSVCYALMDSACAYACASRQVLGVTTNGNITCLASGTWRYDQWQHYLRQRRSVGCDPVGDSIGGQSKPAGDEPYRPCTR